MSYSFTFNSPTAVSFDAVPGRFRDGAITLFHAWRSAIYRLHRGDRAPVRLAQERSLYTTLVGTGAVVSPAVVRMAEAIRTNTLPGTAAPITATLAH